MFRVHPRLRGGLIGPVSDSAKLTGSSPLTRGFALAMAGVGLCYRFIPAYAGVWFCGPRRKVFTTVHPRLRGGLRS